MDDTPNLKLPVITAAQAQKHVTHNEALRALDALVQLSVETAARTTPPADPQNGARYIVAAGASDAWAGCDGQIAAWQDGTWVFFVPNRGWLAWIGDEGLLHAFDGTAWTSYASGLTSVNPVPLVGVNTLADATDRLAVKSDEVLLSHDDVTPGSGSVRAKINKAAAARTATLLFQDGWQGRAEIGLAGDDDLRIKVSADGAVWHDGLVFDRTSGRARFPSGGVREVLTAVRHYYVRNDGNDTHDGLTGTSGGAFATIQKAIDTVATLDLGPNSVVIHVAPGTYVESVTIRSFLGSGTVTLQGDPAAPGNVVIQAIHTSGSTGTVAQSAGDCLFLNGVVGTYVFDGLKLHGTDRCIYAGNHSRCTYRNIQFDGPSRHLHIQTGAVVQCEEYGTNEITASAFTHHIYVNMGGQWAGWGAVFKLPTVATAVSGAFVSVQRLSIVNVGNTSFVNKANVTGKKFSILSNGVVYSNNGGVDFLPGTVAGDTASGGVYL